MFYKITNTESELYKKLKAHTDLKNEMQQKNIEKAKDLLGVDFTTFVNSSNFFCRLPVIHGVQPQDPSKLPDCMREMKGWPGVYEPDTRFKKGREMRDALLKLPNISGYDELKLLGLFKAEGRNIAPLIYENNGIVVLMVDDKYEFEHEDALLITSKEFDKILEAEETQTKN